jgi:hypothetical protein
VIGASRKGSLTFFKPTFITPPAHPLPFHNYLLTYLTGNEMDVTELLPCAHDRPFRRPRTNASHVAYFSKVQRRPLVSAPFLEGVSDGALPRTANAELEKMHIDCDEPS